MRKHTKKQSIWIKPLVTLLVVIAGVMIWYSLPVSKTGDINWVGDANGTVTFALSPETTNITQNTESTLTLSIDTSTSHVTGVQVELMYDKTKLGTPVVTLGNFLPNVFVPVKITDSAISFTVAAPPDSGGKMGTGTLATIKIKPPVVGTSTISYSEMIGAFAIGSQENLMKSASDAKITVTAPVKPEKPSGLRSNCYDSGKKVTLRWDAVSGVTLYKLRLDQKDGSGDKSIDNITKTEYDLDVVPNQKYSWWVHSSKDGIDSDEAKVDNLECSLVASSPNPTPSPTPKPTIKPTPKPTIKASTKPSPSPSITAKPTSTSSDIFASPIPPGSLNDIFKDKGALTTKPTTAKVGFFQKIVLGWQAILDSLANLFK